MEKEILFDPIEDQYREKSKLSKKRIRKIKAKANRGTGI